MKIEPNQALVGIIFLLIGLLTYFIDFINFNYFGSMLVFSGLAFILLYRTKRKSWSLIVGMYLSYIGGMNLLSSFKIFEIVNLYGAMFFIVPGIIFLILYLDKNKEGLLMPASILLWFGFYVCIISIEFFSSFRAGVMYICAAGSLFTMYFLGKGSARKWAFYLACCLAFISIINILASLKIFAVLNFSQVFAIILLLIGIVLIFKAIKRQ